MPKLMLVEDDNNLREIYEARLQAEGYNIVTAKDGEEALAVAKAEKPDLVISDVMMPKISGFEMLDILRNTEGLKTVKVIMLTALGQSDDQQRANQLGADRYLVKSQVTLEDIVKATHELLQDEVQPEESAPAATVAPQPAPTPLPVSQPPEPVHAEPVEPPAAPPPTSAQVPPAAPPVQQPQPIAAAPQAPPSAPVEPVAVPATPPVAPQPAPTPAPTPPPVSQPPEPVHAEPVASAEDFNKAQSNAAKSSDSEAESSSQEAENVNNQIENFVSGATESADAPTAEYTANSGSTSTVTTASSDATAAKDTDDKLINEASNSLASNETSSPQETPTPTEPPIPAPAIKTTATLPTQDDSKAASPSKDAEISKHSTDSSGPNKIAHKINIEPPSGDSSKPDIQTLYALEQAKESPGQAPVIKDNSGSNDDQPDPNSIAL
jgi:CheY-like chemotaxis protein